MFNVKEIADLAREVDKENPQDWADLAVDENSSYDLVAMSVVESMGGMETKVLLAAITSLVVENMLLNMKLIKMAQK